MARSSWLYLAFMRSLRHSPHGWPITMNLIIAVRRVSRWALFRRISYVTIYVLSLKHTPTCIWFDRAVSWALGYIPKLKVPGFVALRLWIFAGRLSRIFPAVSIHWNDAPFSIIGIIVVSILNILYLRWANKQKRIHRAELLAAYADEGRSDGGDRAWKELGDRHPDFIYSYWITIKAVGRI